MKFQVISKFMFLHVLNSNFENKFKNFTLRNGINFSRKEIERVTFENLINNKCKLLHISFVNHYNNVHLELF